MSPRRPLAALALAALGGCVQYNEDCTPLVDNPEAVVGVLATNVDLTKATVRTTNSLMGQLVAESYVNSAPAGSPPIDVGMENSGSIRSDGVCTDHSSLPAGPMLKKTLREVLPFDDTVGALSIEPSRLKAVLEHSVSAFVDASKALGNTPSGQFMQMSGLHVEVDCTKLGEANGVDGQRVTKIDLVHWDASHTLVTTPVWDGTTFLHPDTRIRLATNSFVLGGGSGFTMLTGLDPAVTVPTAESGLNFQIVARWFAATYPGTAGHPALGANSGATKPPGEWVLTSCK